MKSMKAFLCELCLLLTCRNTIVCFIFQMDTTIRGMYPSGRTTVLVANRIALKNGFIEKRHLWMKHKGGGPPKSDYEANLFFLQLSKDKLLAFNSNQTRLFIFKEPNQWIPESELKLMDDVKAVEVFFRNPPVPQNETTIVLLHPYSEISAREETITLIESYKITLEGETGHKMVSSEKLSFPRNKLTALFKWEYIHGFKSGNASYLLGYRIVNRAGRKKVYQNVIVQTYIDQSIHTYAEIVEEIKSPSQKITHATYVSLPSQSIQGKSRDSLWIVQSKSRQNDMTYKLEMNWLVESFHRIRKECAEGIGETVISTIQGTSKGCTKIDGVAKYSSAPSNFTGNPKFNKFRNIESMTGFSLEYTQRIFFFTHYINNSYVFIGLYEYSFESDGPFSYNYTGDLTPLKEIASLLPLSFDLYNANEVQYSALGWSRNRLIINCIFLRACDSCNLHASLPRSCGWVKDVCFPRKPKSERDSCYSIGKVFSYNATSTRHGGFTIELKDFTNRAGTFIAKVFLFDDPFKLIDCSVFSFKNSTIEGELTGQKDGNYGILLSIRYFRYSKYLEPLTFNWTQRHYFYSRQTVIPPRSEDKSMLIAVSLLVITMIVFIVSWYFLVYRRTGRKVITRRNLRNLLGNIKSRVSRNPRPPPVGLNTYQPPTAFTTHQPASGFVSNMFAPPGAPSTFPSRLPSAVPSAIPPTAPGLEDQPSEIETMAGKPPSIGRRAKFISKLSKTLFSRSSPSAPKRR